VKAEETAPAGAVVMGMNIARRDKNQDSWSCEMIDSAIWEVTSAGGNGADKELIVPMAGIGVLNAGTDPEFERIGMRSAPDSEIFAIVSGRVVNFHAAFRSHAFGDIDLDCRP
jgi:hypothetical protein